MFFKMKDEQCFFVSLTRTTRTSTMKEEMKRKRERNDVMNVG